ncbi:MAG TPA: hypothetical protein VE442_02865 [Jatrophihabitans sp.]|nr:hypothetical protein [Jatrophihabitans sp.]
MSFLDFFGSDPTANQGQWERCPGNPVIRAGDAWCAEFVAPSSVLVDGDMVTLYAEGGAGDRESIGSYVSRLGGDFASDWAADPQNPLLEPGANGFDDGSVFDPAAIRFRGRTHVYYSATAGGAHAFAELADSSHDDVPTDETIGHAVATAEGLAADRQPVMAGRCPYVIEHGGELYLFYVLVIAGGYRIFGARSGDGVTFEAIGAAPLLDTGRDGEWDSFTVTTPKVFVDDGQFVMLYAGDNRAIDDPSGIGLAMSTDLVNWRKHPGNPILVPGRPGEFDSLSVSSAVPFRLGGRWHILYAGGARALADGYQAQIGTARLPL